MVSERLPEHVRTKLDLLPASPGVYVFYAKPQRSMANPRTVRAPRDAGPSPENPSTSTSESLPPEADERARRGEVLYVGKARSLRSRVRSYFSESSSDVRAFIYRLERELGDIETFVTQNEKEAALLENQLIKERLPRYNVKLRDDKEFLSLRLDTTASWPRLQVVRKPRKDTARYFGPYHSATAARQTLRLVNRHFQLRTCTDTEFKARVRPCLQYQIKRCPGPCVVETDRDVYGEQVRLVALFLEGRHDELVNDLKGKMSDAAGELAYERAALHRDQIRAVERVRETQRVATARDVDQDVIGLYRQADQAEVAVLQVRGGRLVRVKTYGFNDVALPDDELVARFASLWYEQAPIPDEVLLATPLEALAGFAAMLAELRKTRPTGSSTRAPKVSTPQRGPRRRLVEMAIENAAHAFEEKQRATDDVDRRLGEVQRKLRLPRLPRRIECIDISHSGGEHTVAAIVALHDAQPDKSRYRSFHIKQVSGGDDYGAIYEALSRRFRRGRESKPGDNWELPDLVVVDGGKGQLGVALGARRDMQVEELPVVSLAKEKENVLGEKLVDRVYLPGQKNPIALHSTPALAMLALARDEAHRFSNEARKKLGKKRTFTSELDAIPGVGPKTRARLLQELGSLAAIRQADLTGLLAAGANRRQAQTILQHFGHGPELAGGDPPRDPMRDDPREEAARDERSDDEKAERDDARPRDEAREAERSALANAFESMFSGE